ncbi:MAG: proline dehydrogenase family protein [Chitinophagia bacterium]|jgi:proline dehydrogenase
MGLNFNDTSKAFRYKTDAQLKKALLLFRTMQFGPLVTLGTRLTPWAMKIGMPIKTLIRNTLFEQFVGGESLEQTHHVATLLDQYNVKVILDYGVEGGADDDEKFEKEKNKFIEVIEFASKEKNIPYISIKISGLTSTELLSKLDHTIQRGLKSNSSLTFEEQFAKLTQIDKAEWQKLIERTSSICLAASKHEIGVMVDAEESWFQDAIDQITYMMMREFNSGKAVVYNTIQLYRSDRLLHLKEHLASARKEKFFTGLKLVRGAYMEKERERATKMGYPSPIQPNKDATDRDYDEGVKICMENMDIVRLIVASHNEKSTLKATQNSKDQTADLHFSQLYGMSDHLTFNLADAGYSVSKYLPFGPLEEVIPYLMRRAQENSSLSGQTGRELELLEKEKSRRKGKI